MIARRSTKALDASNCQLIAAVANDAVVVAAAGKARPAEDLAPAHGWG